jgi:hypothetical protein
MSAPALDIAAQFAGAWIWIWINEDERTYPYPQRPIGQHSVHERFQSGSYAIPCLCIVIIDGEKPC